MLITLLTQHFNLNRKVSRCPSFSSSCFLIISIIFGLINSGHFLDINLDFCYDDPTCGPNSPKWDGDCIYGRMQSPVNLDFWKVKRIPKSVNLVLSREYAQYNSFSLMNGGHTVVVYLNNDERSRCLVKGKGFLPDEPWYFSSLHFHWGPHDFVGSEHSINGQYFPLEMHMIHRKQRDESKIAVFGVLFQISDNDNVALNPIVNNLHRIRNLTEKQAVRLEYENAINLTALLPSKIKVFRYDGSLTTPPCSEGLIWTVFDDVQTVSKRQMMEFRKLLQKPGGKPILTNFRPTQPTFTEQRRVVYYMKTIVPAAVRKKKKI